MKWAERRARLTNMPLLPTLLRGVAEQPSVGRPFLARIFSPLGVAEGLLLFPRGKSAMALYGVVAGGAPGLQGCWTAWRGSGRRRWGRCGAASAARLW